MSTANEILDLLSLRHSEDVFVAECKDGPSMTTSHARLDAWAMKKSWAYPSMLGYEIKVSRGDFLRDDKWTRYLNLCNSLYFVCPWGMIEKSEVPDSCGLVYVTKTGSKLVTKKKAPRREIEDPVGLFRYVLFSRTRIDRDGWDDGPVDRLAYWRQWIGENEEGKNVGYRVSRALRKRVDEAETEAKKLRRENERFAWVREFLKQHDVTADTYGGLETFQRVVRDRLIGVPGWVEHSLDSAIRALEKTRTSVKSLRDYEAEIAK